MTASFDGKARIWNAATGEPVKSLEHNKARVYHAAFSPPDGRYLVTAGSAETRIWDVDTGAFKSLPGTAGGEYAAFSADGRYVVTTGDRGQVWNVATGERVTTLEHNAAVSYAAFSPDGRAVVTAGLDHTARIWNAATGEPVGVPLRPTGQVEHLSFSPGGRLLATASAYDGRLQLWDAATGEPVTPALQHPDTVWHASFSPGGRRVLTACGDGAARLWDVPFEERPLAELRPLAEVLAGVRMRAPGTFVPLEPAQFHRDWMRLWSKDPNGETEHCLGCSD